MKIKILKTTVAAKGFVRAGEIVEVSDAEAKTLILLGKAVMDAGKLSHIEPEPEELTTEVAEAIVETKLKRSRKK